jgi:hypothetical protein
MDWLIGIAPARPGDPALTPVGRRHSTADRLRLLLHMSVEEFLRTFPNRDNALDYKYGRALANRVSGRVAVFGYDAWRCLGLPPRQFWEHHQTAAAKFYLLPHPSGLNRLYNTKANRNRLRRLLCRSSPLTSITTGSPSKAIEYRDPMGSQSRCG